MWLIISNFIKNKVFTSTGGFIAIFVVIFSLLILPNLNVVMTKLGFETTTSLKAELIKSQEELKRLKDINNSLNKEITNIVESYEQQIEVLKETKKEIEEINNTTRKISLEKEKKDILPNKLVKKKSNSTNTTIILPKTEIDQLSANNIDAINEAYDSLFT